MKTNCMIAKCSWPIVGYYFSFFTHGDLQLYIQHSTCIHIDIDIDIVIDIDIHIHIHIHIGVLAVLLLLLLGLKAVTRLCQVVS